ncbi:hypothetical protein H2248_001672 [Termitomyces sp. 'cryptogamus']|nr:hypothetical protein H2248_001672 [Termitomyces sp. 'cryptogamus']
MGFVFVMSTAQTDPRDATYPLPARLGRASRHPLKGARLSLPPPSLPTQCPPPLLLPRPHRPTRPPPPPVSTTAPPSAATAAGAAATPPPAPSGDHPVHAPLHRYPAIAVIMLSSIYFTTTTRRNGIVSVARERGKVNQEENEVIFACTIFCPITTFDLQFLVICPPRPAIVITGSIQLFFFFLLPSSAFSPHTRNDGQVEVASSFQ